MLLYRSIVYLHICILVQEISQNAAESGTEDKGTEDEGIFLCRALFFFLDNHACKAPIIKKNVRII